MPAGFLLVPLIAKREINALGSAATSGDLIVESVAFNPFTLNARLRGVIVRDRFASQPLLAVEEGQVDLGARSLLHLAPIVENACS